MDSIQTDCRNDELNLEKELLAPYTYIQQVKSKRLRKKLALAFNHWLRVPEEKLRYILDTVYMFHIASILLDDIQDNTKIRRGIPAAHVVYGIPLTVNTSAHVAFLVVKRGLQLGPRAAEILCQDILEMSRGQGYEIYWRDNFICPTEKEYKDMVKKKTGTMFALGVRLLQLFSDNKTDFSQLALLLGSYFQIRDDYCNLTQQEALEEWPKSEEIKVHKAQSFCEDLTEGKYTLPIIHAMNTSEKEKVDNILRRRTHDVELKKYCVSLLDRAGSLQYTRDALTNLDKAVRDEIARLGGNPDMEAALDELLTWKHGSSTKDIIKK